MVSCADFIFQWVLVDSPSIWRAVFTPWDQSYAYLAKKNYSHDGVHPQCYNFGRRQHHKSQRKTKELLETPEDKKKMMAAESFPID